MHLTPANAEASSSRLPSASSPSAPLRRNRIRRRSSALLLITLLILLVLPLTTAKKSNLFPLKPVMGNKRSNAVGAADASAGAKSFGGRRATGMEDVVVQPRKENVVPKAAVQPPANAPPTKLQPRQIAATAQMGRRKKKDNIPKAKKDYSSFLCPGGSIACPIPPANADTTTTPAAQAKALEDQLNSLADWFRIGFECSEVDSDVENCGACVSLGQGQDCTLIPHSRSTGCESATCQVYQCQEGFVASSDKRECVRRGGSGFGGGQKVIKH